jgi:hypothetical protein
MTSVDVYVDGEKVTEVIITMKVRNFELSDTPPIPTAIGISPECIYKFHGMNGDSPEGKKLILDYFEFFLQHRLSMYAFHYPSLLLDCVPEEKAKEVFGDPRITTVMLPYSDNYEELKKTVNYAKEKGFLHKCYFYAVDEPVSTEQYERIRQIRTMLDSVEPGLALTIPFHRPPEFAPGDSAIDHLKGHANLWCIISWRMDLEREREKLRERQALGEKILWYVCCAPEFPYCNFLVDMDALDHRMLFWQQKYYGVDGLLYWSSTYWGDTENPWVDIATWKSYSDIIYGDGCLIYPGTPMGVDGPCASIRLKLMQKGINDYEYLCLLEKKRGKEYVQNLLSEMIINLSAFDRHVYRLDVVRDRIAEELEAE